MKNTLLLATALLLAPYAFSQSRLYNNEFDLTDVTLNEGPFLKAMSLNDHVLLEYDADRLLQPFQKQAGIKQTGTPFTNWSGEIGSGLDGHVGGHYLSALAMAYASCRDASQKAEIKSRLDYMMNQLSLCQNAVTDSTDVMYGYLGGVPGSRTVWSTFYNANFTQYNASWVPWYNVHKIFAGLRDVWLYTGSEQAYVMFLKLCDWGIRITSKLTDTQMQSILNTEHGGMNEVYADAYQMTRDAKYLTAAKRFSHQIVLTNMQSNTVSYLDNKHANTQIPKVIGFDRIAMLDKTATAYSTAAVNFWKNVTGQRSIALGGNSVAEYFQAISNHSKYITEREGPESCNTYNMLKLSEDLFFATQNAGYVDFYEKALFNHILSTQHPDHGGYVYFTSARPQHYRVYSQVNQAMWCCVGTGMENHEKYGQFIYAKQGQDSLYVNLFISSSLNWKEKGITVTQTTRFPYESGSKLTLNMPADTSVHLDLLVRHPGWVSADGFIVVVNGDTVSRSSDASSYVKISRDWKNGDVVQLSLPMKVTVDPLNGYTGYVALEYGPILLGAKTGSDNLIGLNAGEDRMGHVASGPLKSLATAPILVGNRSALADSIQLTNPDSLFFKINGCYNSPSFNSLRLQPFYTIHDSRYMMYWWQLSSSQYNVIKDSLETSEGSVILLDKRTLDYVTPGAQQSESDHFMQSENSSTGIFNNQPYREATNGGYFSYKMSTKGLSDSISLYVQLYGNETGNRLFSILIDEDTLWTLNHSNTWKSSQIVSVELPVPVRMLAGKSEIRVRFDAADGQTAGGIYGIRLLSSDPVKRNVYRFNARDWGVCDANRAPLSAFTYNDATNSFTITKSGTNNIAFSMSLTKSDYYTVANDKIYFLIKGKNLRTNTGDSYIWWFNGYNNASSVAPAKSVTIGSEVCLLWHIPSVAALYTNMDYSKVNIPVTKNGNSFINAIGLTSSATNFATTITDINFYNQQQIANLYPALAAVVGVPAGIETARDILPGITACTNQHGSLKLAASKNLQIRVCDLQGRLLNSFSMKTNEERILKLQPGIYLVNQTKVAVW